MTSLHLIRTKSSNWGNLVVTYLCVQTVWTNMEDVLQGCGDACR